MITIDQAYFDLAGAIEIHGTVDGVPVTWETNAANRDFDRAIDRTEGDEFTNHEGLYTARFDVWGNLHILVGCAGAVLDRVVRASYFKQILLETYHKAT